MSQHSPFQKGDRLTVRPRLLLQWGAVVGALALVLLLGGSQPAHAGTFNPTFSLSASQNTPEQPFDTSVEFDLPTGDVNFAGVVAFVPNEVGIVDGNKIPVGEDVGNLDSTATLGLIGGPCNQPIPVHFDFKNGSLDRSNTVTFEDSDGNHTADYADDKDGNGLFDGADHYPVWDNNLFPNLQPIGRSVGLTIVAGIPVILQFLVFPPGSSINENIPTDPLLGFPSVTVLQNAGDTTAKPEPGAITDFCTPLLSKNNTFGISPQGTTLNVAPQDGTYTFAIVSLGLRDADGDGYENSLDTCPYQPNAGNPRTPNSGDADGDGLDAVCDPNDNPATGGTNSDQDGDGYLNRQDNCPLIANGQDTSNQRDDDLDQIGNDCDQNPSSPDGALATSTLQQQIVVGTGAGPGGPPHKSACPDCVNTVPDEPGMTPVPTATPPGGGGNVTPGGGGGGTSVTATPAGASRSTSPSTGPSRSASVTPKGSITPTPKSSGGGLSTAAIIGIVVGVGAAVAAAGGGAWYFLRRRA